MTPGAPCRAPRRLQGRSGAGMTGGNGALTMMRYDVHKGVAYFEKRGDAQAKSTELPGSRVVEYQRGYAVQYRISGPYYPELQTGWRSCAGRQNQLPDRPCAICGHMTHERG